MQGVMVDGEVVGRDEGEPGASGSEGGDEEGGGSCRPIEFTRRTIAKQLL